MQHYQKAGDLMRIICVMRKEPKNPESRFSAWESGISAGAGVEVAVGKNWEEFDC